MNHLRQYKEFRRWRAKSLDFFYPVTQFQLSKDGTLMLGTLSPGQTAQGSIAPTTKGSPSKATLSNISFSVVDPTVATIAADPANPNGFILTGVGSGTALTTDINATATATEADGVTTETVSGTDSVGCSLVVASTPVADGLVFTLASPIAPGVPTGASAAKRATLFGS